MATPLKTKILIVEDEMIIAADISMQLTKLGYQVIGIQTQAEGLLETVASNRPDIILMDIDLAGEMDGIDGAVLILESDPIPVIFLTSNTDDATFKRALVAKPFAFISKPFRVSEIRRTLNLIEHHFQLEIQEKSIQEESIQNVDKANDDHVSSMKDRLFIRSKGQLVKVLMSDILFLEAERVYCKVHTKSQTYLLSMPLRTVQSQLPVGQFLRIHRSYVIGLHHVDAVNENMAYLTINNQKIPISRPNKEELGNRLNMI